MQPLREWTFKGEQNGFGSVWETGMAPREQRPAYVSMRRVSAVALSRVAPQERIDPAPAKYRGTGSFYFTEKPVPEDKAGAKSLNARDVQVPPESQ